jgi:hypothetical protein
MTRLKRANVLNETLKSVIENYGVAEIIMNETLESILNCRI